MRKEINRWKGVVLGMVGGAVGVFAMDGDWKPVTAITGEDPHQASKKDSEQNGRGAQQEQEEEKPLDDISLVGQQHEEGESSTGAVGRILYEQVTGKEPRSKETKTTLSYLVHWAFGMSMAGMYGALRGPARIPDIPGGLALAVGLWALGDELAVPLLGLAEGPTAFPPELHAHTLGAHIAYGLTSAAVAQTLDRIT
jgi:hypothetical protein